MCFELNHADNVELFGDIRFGPFLHIARNRLFRLFQQTPVQPLVIIGSRRTFPRVRSANCNAVCQRLTRDNTESLSHSMTHVRPIYRARLHSYVANVSCNICVSAYLYVLDDDPLPSTRSNVFAAALAHLNHPPGRLVEILGPLPPLRLLFANRLGSGLHCTLPGL